MHALAATAGDAHGVAGFAVVLDDSLAARGEQAFGRLAHEDEVDARARGSASGSGTPGIARTGRTPAYRSSSTRRSSWGAISVPSG